MTFDEDVQEMARKIVAMIQIERHAADEAAALAEKAEARVAVLEAHLAPWRASVEECNERRVETMRRADAAEKRCAELEAKAKRLAAEVDTLTVGKALAESRVSELEAESAGRQREWFAAEERCDEARRVARVLAKHFEGIASTRKAYPQADIEAALAYPEQKPEAHEL